MICAKCNEPLLGAYITFFKPVRSDYHKECAMLLYYTNKVKELRTTDYMFFQTAYVWRFNKPPVVEGDYCQFVLHSILPSYVREYLTHLQRSERSPP